MSSLRYNPYSFGATARGPIRQRSRRNVRGAGWHRRGYRDNGDMWINFWRQVVRGVEMEDGFPLPEDEPITTLFDGGETVYAKVYDEDDRERVWDGISWTYHTPRRR
ncbi:unnamed protein product [Peniophora sp. CBMAI 1063]|nr:unnamed protein product [Peniophora sp. CBMAI 1063]